MSAAELKDVRDGTLLPDRSYKPTLQQLFLYAASTWNVHRIHYDAVYACEVEKYEAIVIQGPLVADMFTQSIMEWLGGRGRIERFDYSNRGVSYLGEELTSRICVRSCDAAGKRLELTGHIENAKGEIVLPGTATITWI